MAQTLLQLCTQASAEMGIVAPATIVSNTALYPVQLLNLINGVGQDLQREYNWQRCTLEHSFTTEFLQYTGNSTNGSTSLTSMSSIAGLDTTYMVSGSGIPVDTFVVSASSTTVVISRAATATGTTTTFTFSKVQYSLPSDYDRLIDSTEWDKSQTWPMQGPNSAQQWQWLKGGGIAGGSVAKFRVIRNLFQIYPPLGSENYLRFEYVSNLWAIVTGSTSPTKTAFSVDTDTSVFPDRLMIESLKLRFKRAEGLAMVGYTPSDQVSGFPTRLLDIAKAGDAGSPTLSMAPRYPSVLINMSNMPEGNYGS